MESDKTEAAGISTATAATTKSLASGKGASTDLSLLHPCGLPQALFDANPEFTPPAYYDKPFKAADIKRTVFTGCPRQKKCTISEERQAKYRAILEKTLHDDYMYGDRFDYDIDDIESVVQDVLPILMGDPMIYEEISTDVYVIGDLHGQLVDLNMVFCKAKELAKSERPGYECGRFVFLGDYVDRGHQSIEIIMTLFILKILYPGRYFLLRGNHEFYNINADYGFVDECIERYGKHNGMEVCKVFNLVFAYLSVAAVIGNNHYFCVHGGISVNGISRSQIRNMKKPIFKAEDNSLLQDLVWADPMSGLRGSMFNEKRELSVYFGEDLLYSALCKVDCHTLIRGHSTVEGFASTFGGRCLTVFTCRGGIATNVTNDAAFIHIGLDHTINVYIVPFNPEIGKYLLKLRGSNGNAAEDEITCDDKPGIARLDKSKK